MKNLKITLSLINLVALAGAVIWFFTAPFWDSGITAVGLLGTLLAQVFTNEEIKSKLSFAQKSKSGSHNYMAAGNQTIADNKKIQNGGEGSQLIQADVINIHGVDEKRAREIYQEMNLQLKKDYTQEALIIASSRIKEFENRLMPKMDAVNGALEAFADPSFQLLLVEAQKTAASTERVADYDLLSELLIHRFQKGENRITRAGITRAVEIVDKISDDALLGLTVAHSVSYFVPASGDIQQGLNVLDNLYSKLVYGALPPDKNWLDHLDILDAIRINSFGTLKKIEQWYPELLSGYVEVGIEKKSENYTKAVEILSHSNISQEMLVDHIFNNDFVRLNVVSFGQMEKLQTYFSENQLVALKSIYDLYKKDGKIKKANIATLMEEWDKRKNLRILKDWWDNIGSSFQITSVGRVLAHSNAQRCDKSLPPLN